MTRQRGVDNTEERLDRRHPPVSKETIICFGDSNDNGANNHKDNAVGEQNHQPLPTSSVLQTQTQARQQRDEMTCIFMYLVASVRFGTGHIRKLEH